MQTKDLDITIKINFFSFPLKSVELRLSLKDFGNEVHASHELPVYKDAADCKFWRAVSCTAILKLGVGQI
jgi:hypothetical protein